MDGYFIDLLRFMIWEGDKITSELGTTRPIPLAYLLEIDFGKRRKALSGRSCGSFHMKLLNISDSPIAENAFFCEIYRFAGFVPGLPNPPFLEKS